MKTTTELITPEIAFEMLKHNKSNRTISKSTVNFYADQMEKGEWKTTSQGIAIATDDRIIDGQHRLMAILKTKIPQTMIVTRGLNYSEVFSVYDTGKTRSAGDVLSIRGVTSPNTVSAALKTYYGLIKKHRSIRSGGGVKLIKLSNTELMDMYIERKDLFDHIYEDVLKGISTKLKIISNSTILGVSYYLIIEKNHEIDKVKSFFLQLINGNEITNETILVLRNKIIETRLRGQRFNKEEHLIYMKKTWNSFILGKTLSRFNITPTDRESDFI